MGISEPHHHPISEDIPNPLPSSITRLKYTNLSKMAPADALRQDNILDLAVRAIQPAGDRQPSLKTQYEAVALIGHACMVAVDFRLVGLSEDHNLGMSSLL